MLILFLTLIFTAIDRPGLTGHIILDRQIEDITEPAQQQTIIDIATITDSQIIDVTENTASNNSENTSDLPTFSEGGDGPIEFNITLPDAGKAKGSIEVIDSETWEHIAPASSGLTRIKSKPNNRFDIIINLSTAGALTTNQTTSDQQTWHRIHIRQLKADKDLTDVARIEPIEAPDKSDSILIAPKTLDFESMIVSGKSTTAGRVLVKCTNYSLSERSCIGEWTPLRMIEPYGEYTVELTPEDPVLSIDNTGIYFEPFNIVDYDADTNGWERETPWNITSNTTNGNNFSSTLEDSTSGSFKALSINVSTLGFRNITVNFWAAVGTGMDAGENITAWWSNGTDLTTMFTQRTSTPGIVLQINLSTNATSANNPLFRLSFGCKNNGQAGEVCMIDNVTVTGNNTPPSIVNFSPSNAEYNQFVQINISANATDDLNVSNTTANVTLPGGAVEQVRLSPTLNGLFEGILSNTSTTGDYNITIIVFDQAGYSNKSASANFSVREGRALNITFVNITPINPANGSPLAGAWNYTGQFFENGSIYTFFINDTEAWRDDSMLAYFRFDNGDINDTLGTAVGEGNYSISQGIIRAGVDFMAANGTGIVYSNFSRFNVSLQNAITITAWVNPRTFLGLDHLGALVPQAGIAAKYNGGTDFDYGLIIDDNRTTAHIWTGNINKNYRANGTTILKNNTWQHVAMTYNGTNLTVYVNGRFDGTIGGINQNIQGSITPFFIGRVGRTANRGPDYFNGTIDEVKVFNRSLTPDEIANEYQMMSFGQTERDALGSTAQDIPEAIWHFEDSQTGTRTEDFMGDHNGTLYNGATFGAGTGMWGGSCAAFDGKNSSVRTSHNNLNLTNKITIEAWVSVSGATSGSIGGSADSTQTIIQISNSSDTNFTTSEKIGLFWLNKTTNTSNFMFSIQNRTGSAATKAQVVSTTTIGPNTGWHHIAGVWNGTVISIFIDGIIEATRNATGNLSPGANSMTIGNTAHFQDTLPFNGTIDEIAIYQRAFTPDEINQSYRRGFPLFGMNFSRYGSNSSVKLQVIPIQYDGAAGQAVNSSPVSTNTQSADSTGPRVTALNISPSNITAGNSANITVNATDAESAVDKVIAQITRANGSAYNLTMTLMTGIRYNATVLTTAGDAQGRWNVTIIANDTSGNRNASVRSNFTVWDINPPVLAVSSVSSTEVISGDWVCIIANITDESGVANATAGIIGADGSNYTVTLSDNISCNSLPNDGVWTGLFHTTTAGNNTFVNVTMTDTLLNSNTTPASIKFNSTTGTLAVIGETRPYSVVMNDGTIADLTLINTSNTAYPEQVMSGTNNLLTINFSAAPTSKVLKHVNMTVYDSYSEPVNVTVEWLNGSTWTTVCAYNGTTGFLNTTCDITSGINNVTQLGNASLRLNISSADGQATQKIDHAHLSPEASNATILLNATRIAQFDWYALNFTDSGVMAYYYVNTTIEQNESLKLGGPQTANGTEITQYQTDLNQPTGNYTIAYFDVETGHRIHYTTLEIYDVIIPNLSSTLASPGVPISVDVLSVTEGNAVNITVINSSGNVVDGFPVNLTANSSKMVHYNLTLPQAAGNYTLNITDTTAEIWASRNLTVKAPYTMNTSVSQPQGTNITADVTIIKSGETIANGTNLQNFTAEYGTKYTLIFDLHNSTTTQLRFDEVQNLGEGTSFLAMDPGNDTHGFLQYMAFNPAGTNFTTVNMTFNGDPNGRFIKKCTNYNFTTQTCIGEWDIIAPLAPGEQNVVQLPNSDPALSVDNNGLFFENFESGTFATNQWKNQTNWNISADGVSQNAEWLVGTSGGGYRNITVNVSTLGFRNISLKAALKTQALDAGEALAVFAYNGTTSVQLGNLTVTSYTIYQTNLTGEEFNASSANNFNFQLVFGCKNNGGANERCFVDNISIFGNTTPPVVNNLTPSDQEYGQFTQVNISVNVTDDLNVSNATANLTLPGGGKQLITLSFLANNYWIGNTTNTSALGDYNITIIAFDQAGFSNRSVSTNFSIRDRTPPNVTALNASPSNITAGGATNITVNVTDNVGVDKVLAQVSRPDGTAINITMSLLSGSRYNATLTTIASDPSGLWNITIIANDTRNNVNNSVRTNITVNAAADAPPNVTALNISPSNITQGQAVNITVNATDNIGVDKVYAQVTRSNGSAYNLTMTPLAGMMYNATVLTTTGDPPGLWNVTIIANDTTGNRNASVKGNFTVVDTTAPSVTALNISPQIIMQTNTTNITVNVSDNYLQGVGTVLAQITRANGSGYNITMSLLNGITYNATVNTSREEPSGLYNVTIIANDTSGNRNASVRSNFTVQDINPPRVFDERPTNGTGVNLSQTIEVSVNASDDASVDNVTANVTLPNSSVNALPLTRVSGDQTNGRYNATFTVPDMAGEYTVRFIANDTGGLANNSVITKFNANRLNQFNINSTDSNGAPVNITLLIYNSTGNLVVNASRTTTNISLAAGLYNATIIPSNQSRLLNITITNLNINRSFSLIGIDYPNASRYANGIEPFALNPATGNFEYATITRIAENATLYKCLNWNYTARVCGAIGCSKTDEEAGLCQMNGTWERRRENLTSATIYQFNITTTDPGFSEYTESAGENSTASTTFINKTNLTIAPLNNGSHLILTTAQLHGNSLTSSVLARLLVDGTNVSSTMWEPRDSNIAADYPPYGASYVAALDTASNHTAVLQWASEAGVDTFIKNARISVIEATAIQNSSVEDNTTLTTTLTPAATLNFTPSISDRYLIIASGEINNNDCTETVLAELQLDGKGIENMSYECKDTTDIRPFLFHNVSNLTTGGQHNLSLMARSTLSGGGFVRRARIQALRMTPDFDVHTAANDTPTTSTTSALANRTVLTFTPPEAAEYLFIATAEHDSGGASDQTRMILDVNGSDKCDLIEESRISTITEMLPYMCIAQINLTTSAHTAAIEFAAQGAGATVTLRNARITAIRATPDRTPPRVFDAEANGTIFNVSQRINFTINATDNLGVSAVRGNITLADGTFKKFNLSFLTGNVYNATINDTIAIGQYNISILAEDFAGNQNNTEKFLVIINDTVRPSVTNLSPNDTVFNDQNISIRIAANITDNGFVNTAIANVTLPNGSIVAVQMTRSETEPDIWNGTFNQTNRDGMYNISVRANDTANNINSTEKANFSVFLVFFVSLENSSFSIQCTQTATIDDQIICSVDARDHITGFYVNGLNITYNVTNQTGGLTVRGNATSIGRGNYRINFSVSAPGGYITSVAVPGTNFSASAPTIVRTGFTAGATVTATGTLFFPENRIVVDALYLGSSGVPQAGAGCNLTLESENLTTILENATMPQISVGGIPHYVYNSTNITATNSNWTEGKFFGHVRCDKAPPLGGLAYTRVEFEVRRFNISSTNGGTTDITPVLNSINDTRLLLQSLLDKQYQFSQEEVYLVTDAFNTMTELESQVQSGAITPQEAKTRFEFINQSLHQSLGDRAALIRSQPLATPRPQETGTEPVITRIPIQIKDGRQTYSPSWIDKITIIMMIAIVVIIFARIFARSAATRPHAAKIRVWGAESSCLKIKNRVGGRKKEKGRGKEKGRDEEGRLRHGVERLRKREKERGTGKEKGISARSAATRPHAAKIRRRQKRPIKQIKGTFTFLFMIICLILIQDFSKKRLTSEAPKARGRLNVFLTFFHALFLSAKPASRH